MGCGPWPVVACVRAKIKAVIEPMNDGMRVQLLAVEPTETGAVRYGYAEYVHAVARRGCDRLRT